MWFLITAFDAELTHGERNIMGLKDRAHLKRYLRQNDWDSRSIEELISQGYKKDGGVSYWAGPLRVSMTQDITLP